MKIGKITIPYLSQYHRAIDKIVKSIDKTKETKEDVLKRIGKELEQHGFLNIEITTNSLDGKVYTYRDSEVNSQPTPPFYFMALTLKKAGINTSSLKRINELLKQRGK